MKRQNDFPISTLLKQWSQSPKLKPNLIQQKLENQWEAWFGKLISKNTEKLTVKQNILYIQVKSGPVKYEMKLGRIAILNLIHEKLGENYFDQIIVQ
ncbi:MAG: DUF721 domain-containing protein [Saprospiraceae bacterium]